MRWNEWLDLMFYGYGQVGACHIQLGGAEIWWFMILAFESSDFALSFLSLFLEGAPYILLGTLISGFMDVYMPASLLERALPKNKWLAVLSCGFMGLILPVCECAVVPVIRRLVAKGLPVSCAFTYMLAAPILNPVTIWSTWHAFAGQEQWSMVLTRCAMGYGVAAFVGLVLIFTPIEKVLRRSILKTIRSHDDADKGVCGDKECEKTSCDSHEHKCGHTHDHGHCEHTHEHSHSHDEDECCGHDHGHTDCTTNHEHKKGSASKIVLALRSGMRDCVDVGVYFTIGACLAAMFNILYVLHQKGFEEVLVNRETETIGMMLLAFVLSVCSTSDAFMAATVNFVSYGPKMAFMVLGPMLDVKLLFLYQTVMKKRFLLYLSLGLFVLIGVLTWTWEEVQYGPENKIEEVAK